MNNFASFTKKLKHHLRPSSFPIKKLPNPWTTTHQASATTTTIKPSSSSSLFRTLALYIKPFYLQLIYFLIMSLIGFMGLKILNLRTTSVSPSNFDLFFTSVSTATVSSMTALEMEIFSNSQLILMTFLMFVGGEVFTSMLDLFFSSFSLKSQQNPPNFANDQIELAFVDPNADPHNDTNFNQKRAAPCTKLPPVKSGKDQMYVTLPVQVERQFHGFEPVTCRSRDNSNLNLDQNDDKIDTLKLKHKSIKCLGFVVLGYIVVLNLVGSGMVSSYITLVPSARQVLRNKGINIQTFSLFTIVSTFASCGFVPTNENMMVFKNNSGLLLLVLPFVFFGNTLYPPFLRLVIWGLEKVTKREEFGYILRNYKEVGYEHMLSGVRCWLLVATVLGLNLMQLVLFCCMEWNSEESMEGLNSNYEKFVASLFQVSNARHAGESVFDLSSLSSAILVLFVVMMYLPPYTTYLPIREDKENKSKKEKRSLVKCLLFSQLSYLVIFIILICITERKSLRQDPLNFNVLNITLEVISAYGNVGFSMGYSCKRQMKVDGKCKDLWVGFSGRWSNKGKFILIVVMFFGRLKKFNMRGGKAWDLS